MGQVSTVLEMYLLFYPAGFADIIQALAPGSADGASLQAE
jgi:hypothetical protein